DIPQRDTTPPSRPRNLHVVSTGLNYITLGWNSAEDLESGIRRYNINMSLVGSNEGFIVESIDTSITIAPLPQGYSYMISIDAVNGWELKTRGDTVFTNTLGEIDTIPPSIPQNVKVTNTTKSSISLSWDKSTDNEVVSGYLIGVL